MAYRGTANNAAIQKLLHFAVGDVSDDVRRAAVLNLGFVLMNVPQQCPRIVRLLSESYNPHVRYGGPPCFCPWLLLLCLPCSSTALGSCGGAISHLLADWVVSQQLPRCTLACHPAALHGAAAARVPLPARRAGWDAPSTPDPAGPWLSRLRAQVRPWRWASPAGARECATRSS